MSLASLRNRDVVLGAAATLVLSIPSFVGVLPFSTIEVAGFVTGGICVWLLVRENVWNWPVGIADSGLYFVVFLKRASSPTARCSSHSSPSAWEGGGTGCAEHPHAAVARSAGSR